MDFLAASFIQSTLNFFIQGGLFMFFLLIVSVGAVTVMILRGRALREKAVIVPAIRSEIERLQPGDSLTALRDLVQEYPSPLGSVVNTLMKHLSWPRSEAVEAVQTRARHEIARMESGLSLLEIATGISPLLGLLGTLSGLIRIFTSLGTDPVAVAHGIAEALNATIGGLAVAVPCLIAHSYFQRRVEVMAIEMESLASELVSKCYPKNSGE